MTARIERGREELETRMWDRKAGEGKDSYDRTAAKDSPVRTARTGQQHRIATSGQPGQVREDRTARTRQNGQNSWDRTAGTVLGKGWLGRPPGQDSLGRTASTGEPEQEKMVRI